MTIKEVEELTGLSRSNIRFYEKEMLITPARNEGNGYRDYSPEDVKEIKKIAFLRSIDISVEEIRSLKSGKSRLPEVLRRQEQKLKDGIQGLEQSRHICEQMLKRQESGYESLDVEQYVENLNGYVENNKEKYGSDTVSFFYLWGSSAVWAVLTSLCLLAAVCSYSMLPEKIPIQWNGEAATTQMAKEFIFLYTAACGVIRFFLRPFIWRSLRLNGFYSDIASDYLANFLCFVALSVEIFTILFCLGHAKHVSMVLLIDAAVFVIASLAAWLRCRQYQNTAE
ncbi:MerR family transcriptional regulator [Qiania dongpingensis]|uniref:MerR family transcriptional regulator n=1 Tax=Qiania dongpingensis TaxID=2763669 RepID=A0A7G9G2G5_9FIRM|nr:MerR family transcriptional regulator [Qiania dongpingensis]QNM04997.1 MerR family transcriptional regulator [Qiania dongpingensis]